MTQLSRQRHNTVRSKRYQLSHCVDVVAKKMRHIFATVVFVSFWFLNQRKAGVVGLGGQEVAYPPFIAHPTAYF